jgi:hypothetical protein
MEGSTTPGTVSIRARPTRTAEWFPLASAAKDPAVSKDTTEKFVAVPIRKGSFEYVPRPAEQEPHDPPGAPRLVDRREVR